MGKSGLLNGCALLGRDDEKRDFGRPQLLAALPDLGIKPGNIYQRALNRRRLAEDVIEFGVVRNADRLKALLPQKLCQEFQVAWQMVDQQQRRGYTWHGQSSRM